MESAIMLKRSWGILFFIFIMVIVYSTEVYMNKSQYQMAVLVTPDSEDDPEWPNKRKWFDASKWLNSPQYVKIDDFYLLNLKYHPIDNRNSMGAIIALHHAIRDFSKNNHNFSELNEMNNDVFYSYMKDKISYEYLRSRFDTDTLEPTNDYFLLYFYYNGEEYEVELLRKMTKYGLMFMPFEYHMNKKGYWHAVDPAAYSYQDYIDGKSIR